MRPLAESDREIGKVAVGGLDGLLLGAALAAALGAGHRDLDLLLEARRPDQLAADAGATIDARDRRALAGGQPVDRVQARPLDRAGARRTAEQGLVDAGAGDAADRLADDGADRPAQRRAERAAGDLEKKRGHQSVTPGKEKAWL